MNNEAAKMILQAYRDGGQDAADPRFHEALAQAQRDPELAQWFAAEQALDARLRVKLNQSITPPAELKSQLLAQRNIVRAPAWWQRGKVRYALAACFALFATIATFWLIREQPYDFTAFDSGFGGYRAGMTDFTGHKLRRLEFRSRDMVEVRRWLAQKNAPAELTLPPGLNGYASFGCRVLDWRGHKVTLVCFDLPKRQVAHLLVVDRSVFTDAPGATPEFRQMDGIATASWSDAGKTYLVVCKNSSEAELQRLF